MKRHSRESKLAHILRDEQLARALVQAGLDLPRKIKAARDEDLERVHGVGPATRKTLRRRFPKAD